MNPSEPGALTFWRVETEVQVGTWIECKRARGTHVLESADEGEVRTWNESERARGTHVLQTEEQVRTQEEPERAKSTHFLESGDRGKSQNTEIIRASEEPSLSGERKPRKQSGHRKNPSERGALTFWRLESEDKVRTWKESEQVRGTHGLENGDGETSQDTERVRASDRHSLPRGRRPRDKSRHGMDLSE
jgi:hypothetical protein